MTLPSPPPPPGSEEVDDDGSMAWGWRATLIAVGLGIAVGLAGFAPWAPDLDWRGRDTNPLPIIGGVIIFVGLVGRFTTARKQRWTNVHLAWRPGEAAPSKVRNRGSVGRSDTVAMTFLLLFGPMFAFVVFVYAVWYEETAAMVLGIAGMGVGIVGVLAMPGLAPRIVVTRRTVSVRNLFVRQDVPRHLLAWVTTYPAGRRRATDLSDGDIEFGLTAGTPVRFAAGASGLGRGTEYFNRRAAKLRVARRLTRLLDSVPAELVAEGEVTTRRRYGVIVAYAVIAVAGIVGTAVLAASA
jgi:hypothetical protein